MTILGFVFLYPKTQTEATAPAQNTNTIVSTQHTPKIVQDTQKTVPSTTTKQAVQFVSPDINIAKLRETISIRQNKDTIAMSEVARHTTLNDCYLVINGNVYDVTPFIPFHPAGSRIIEQYCGQEVTNIFARIHSNRAWDLLAKYKIGTVTRKKYNIMPEILSALATALTDKNPQLLVVKITPKNNSYIAKVALHGIFYELHINQFGKITQEEVSSNENWKLWEVDVDDS